MALRGNTISSTPSGGTIAITTNRATSDTVPESVVFGIDFTGSTFDTSGPGGDGYYDPRKHDIEVIWNFGETGRDTWDKPVNLTTAQNQRQTAYGHDVSHMFTTTGSKTVTVIVWEPSSGKVSLAETTITNTAFSGVVYAVNNVADPVFTGKTTGAVEYNVDSITSASQIWIDARAETGPVQLEFKGGSTFEIYLNTLSSADDDGYIITSYGTGQAILAPQRTSNNIMFGEYTATNHARSAKVDWRFHNISGLGDWNSQTNQLDNGATTVQAFWATQRAAVRLMMYDVNVSGFVQFVYMQDTNGSGDGADVHGYNCHLCSCSTTNSYGEYQVMVNQNNISNSSYSATGNRFVQDVDATSGSNQAKALNRIQSIQTIHVRGNDYYHTDSRQPVCKFLETPQMDGINATIQNNSFESPYAPVTFGRNFTQSFGNVARTAIANVIFEGNIVVAGYATQRFTRTYVAGLTIRSNLYVMLDQVNQLQMSEFFSLQNYTLNSAPATNIPIRIYSNQIINVRTHANNASQVPATIENTGTGDYTAFTNVTFENNVVHQPNASPAQTVANLDASTVLFAARQKGYKDPVTPYNVTANTVPTDSNIYSFAPLTGASAVIGAYATGLLAQRDLENNYRNSFSNVTGVLPVGGRTTPSTGAHEPALAS